MCTDPSDCKLESCIASHILVEVFSISIDLFVTPGRPTYDNVPKERHLESVKSMHAAVYRISQLFRLARPAGGSVHHTNTKSIGYTRQFMDTPRSRQSRPPRQGDAGRGRGRGRGFRGPSHHNTTSNANVPSIQQVVPGATVFIVLKEDQPTGREVQGVVQDLLTRGNHPRGIKVRLQDGRVGRVQRMVGGGTTAAAAAPRETVSQTPAARPNRILRMEEDVRLYEAEYPEGPPARTFADYFPGLEDHGRATQASEQAYFPTTTATAKCPICGTFEGDEIAVSRHVDEHLT